MLNQARHAPPRHPFDTGHRRLRPVLVVQPQHLWIPAPQSSVARTVDDFQRMWKRKAALRALKVGRDWAWREAGDARRLALGGWHSMQAHEHKAAPSRLPCLPTNPAVPGGSCPCAPAGAGD